MKRNTHIDINHNYTLEKAQKVGVAGAIYSATYIKLCVSSSYSHQIWYIC